MTAEISPAPAAAAVTPSPGQLTAYVVHLARALNRKSWMERQMSTSGFEWIFWDATDGNDFEKDDYKGWFAGRYYECPWLTQALGTWACGISHIRLWHHLLGSPPKEGLAFIFEDDAEIHPGMADRWPEIAGELPKDWDFVFFGPWDSRCIDDRGRHSEHFHRLIRVEATPTTTAYAVNVRRLSANLQRILPLDEEIDLHLSRRVAALKLFVYGHSDWLARAAPGFPSIRV
jgi:hypothetical protein